MNDYGMNNGSRNTDGRAEGQDNPAHNHNFSLQRYVADVERNVYQRRPIVRLPEERRPDVTETNAVMPQEPATSDPAKQRNTVASRTNERNVKSPIKRPREDEYIPEPPLGFYPLAGRTTYIGSHKKHANKKLFSIIIAAIVIVLAFVFLNFGEEILGFIKGIGKEDTAAAFFHIAISDTYTL